MCTSPLRVRVDRKGPMGYRDYVTVPCGHCFECLKKRQNDFQLRLSWEFERTHIGVFFTLTYNESTVPLHLTDRKAGELVRTLCYDDVRNAIKRFRTNMVRSGNAHLLKNFKYFICGEYGKKGRPHYHGIFFGVPFAYVDRYFLNDWRRTYGFVHRRSIGSHDGCMRYVAKYCVKGDFDYYRFHKKELVKPRCYCSHGIGDNYVDLFANYHLCKDYEPDVNTYKGMRYQSRSRVVFGRKFRGYSEEFLSRVVSRRFTSPPDAPSLRYSMPAYYRKKIFGRFPLLQVAMSDFVSQEHYNLYCEKLEQLQDSLQVSSYEASALLCSQEAELSRRRNEACKQSLVSFYKKQVI